MLNKGFWNGSTFVTIRVTRTRSHFTTQGRGETRFFSLEFPSSEEKMPASNHGVEQCFRKCPVCRNYNFKSSASADGQAGLILGGPCVVLPVARQSLTCPWALKLQQLSLSRSQGASECNPRTGPSRQRKAIVLWIHQKGKKARRMRDKQPG